MFRPELGALALALSLVTVGCTSTYAQDLAKDWPSKPVRLIVNFALNYTFNFRFAGRPAGAQLRTFIVVALGGGVLMVLIAHGLVWLAGWIGLSSPLHVAGMTLQIGFIAHVIATGVLTFYSFAAHSAFSFNVGLRARLRRAFSAAA